MSPYLELVRLLEDGQETPIEMLALKMGASSQTITDLLDKLAIIRVVEFDVEKKKVKLAPLDRIPAMNEFYSLAS
jgi:Mn-dependent DtxR family transcriptional regulator